MRSRAQPQQKNPKSNFRTLPMQMREVSQEDRTVELSFSSENPVDRWFGPEILCHDEGCVDLTRLQNVGSVSFPPRQRSELWQPTDCQDREPEC